MSRNSAREMPAFRTFSLQSMPSHHSFNFSKSHTSLKGSYYSADLPQVSPKSFFNEIIRPYTLNQQILGFVLIDICYSMDLRRFDFCSLTWIQDYRFIRILSFNLDNPI